MSDNATKPAATFANWVLSVAGVLGSLAVVAGVLAVSYLNTRPTEKVDADVVAERVQKLKDVQAKEAQLYNNYAWVDQAKGIVRIPMEEAMKLTVARLGKATANKPPAPERLSLGASPEAMTPLPPPVTTAPVKAAAAKPPATPAAAKPVPATPAPATPTSAPASPAPATPAPASASPAAVAVAGTAGN